MRLIGIFQRAIGVVELGTLFQAPLLFLAAGARIEVGMKLAAQLVEVSAPVPRTSRLSLRGSPKKVK